MERISSRQTFFFKRIFPFIFIGIAAPGLIGSIFIQTTNEAKLHYLGLTALFVFVPLAVAGLFSWYFVDEVWVDGENLIVKKRKREIIIPIRQISKIEYSVLVRPGYITLALFEPCALGKRINYHPCDSWGLAFPFETCASVVRLQEKMVPNQFTDPTP